MMTRSQRRAARVAGIAYLLATVIVVSVNFGIHDRLIVAGNPSVTAQNILAHETQFRVGIVGDLIYCLLIVVVLTALYVVLEPVSRGVALLAALSRLVWSLLWLNMTLSLFVGLRLLHAKGVEPQTAQALARLFLSSRFDSYYVGLSFGGLAPTLCAYLFWKSNYIPRALAMFGVIASAWSVLCTLMFLIFPQFNHVVNLWWFDTGLALFDIALSIWLLVKGLPEPAQ